MKNHVIANLLHAKVVGMMAESKALVGVSHPGLVGRFREILVGNVLLPFLPSSCLVVHGTTVDVDGRKHEQTEDDVLIVDRDAVAPTLLSSSEGIVPYESVLARIEVKTNLRVSDLAKVITDAATFRNLRFCGSQELEDAGGIAPSQTLFAFDSDIASGQEFAKLHSALVNASAFDGKGTPHLIAMCIAGRGFWMFGSVPPASGHWYQYSYDVAPIVFEELVCWIGKLLTNITELQRKRARARVGPNVGNYVVDDGKLSPMVV